MFQPSQLSAFRNVYS